ncbi:hypothetical protein D9601_09350 [Sphingomonas sp. MA1305]|uniref:hypothetical protein n=1 Tax=Sphingomonas sp. MA1305 TaxID=2479204 RepID=UPI0018DF3E02|nr:hypothetical protein [Sphingomonas sp. MA1305]MBI0475555.1 hypothetical protein [Sphingomonas sp. MA1305]
MNDSATSAPGSSLLPDTTTLFTTAHLVVIGIFALLAILGLVWGARLKARRKAAERQIVAHNEEVRRDTPAATATTEPSASAPTHQDVEMPATVQPPIRPAPPPADADPAATQPLADEPIAANAPLTAAPQQEAISAPSTDSAGDPNDASVTQLKGLGPKVATRLAELGITRVGQLAVLSDDEAAALDAELGTFRGRLSRDRWVEQARLLAAGDVKGFEAVFGRL